ncbi:MAG: 16S rRNA (guanine(527)-N(7))-methyltransferase RsmG [Clostridiales bacterium]|nr:16S rRNA (guanine(527)-N(7))-methyltransferase RsmG [Clostridiales bacterium]MCD8215426.1 16S rRNA (guanine(527)-N(7))-methyltransferase RsmG [Clostridiales bacterium]
MKNILIQNGVSEKAAEDFVLYKELLLDWNGKINLTAITDEYEIAYKHFLDSLSPLKFTDFNGKSVIDVGTGAGFPGLPVKIAEPSVRLVLLDSLNKRVNFLKEVVSALGLRDVDCIHQRAEEAARTPLRENFDFALSRAVADMSVLAELCLPFVKVGGYFIALKGPEPEAEVKKAEKAVKLLGGRTEKTEKITICDFTHTLVYIKKVRPTPKTYPRQYSKIKKLPL